MVFRTDLALVLDPFKPKSDRIYVLKSILVVLQPFLTGDRKFLDLEHPSHHLMVSLLQSLLAPLLIVDEQYPSKAHILQDQGLG